MPTLGEHPTRISFTPIWFGLTVGSGANVGYYIMNSDDEMTVVAQFTFAADSSVTGQPTMVMPNSGSAILPLTVNTVTLRDSSTPRSYPGFGENVTNGNWFDLFADRFGVSASYVTREPVSATVPFTWTTGDIIRLAFTAVLA
jgi:hypothetical protein